jgi:hypothetical protein
MYVIGTVSIANAQQSPTDVNTLQEAKVCAKTISKFGFTNPTPGAGTISMANDGGWCWLQLSMISNNTYVIPGVTVTQPPRHGTMISGGVDTSAGKRLRLAYKPVAGFSGTDSFSVHFQLPSGTLDANVAVTVTK